MKHALSTAAKGADAVVIVGYENYIKMTKESAYHAMSYMEKRRRDKKFGKLVKHVMKHKPRNR